MGKKTKNISDDVICILCYKAKPLQKYSELPCCRSLLCYDCLTIWLITKTKSNSYQETPKIPCVNQTCKIPLNLNEILPKLDNIYQERINEALLKVYINETKDVYKCPRNGCSYAGSIDPDIECFKPLKCPCCEMKWREKVQYERLGANTGTFSNRLDDVYSNIWKVIYTKKCPKCKVRIEKEEGCLKVKCKKCKNNFCWICKRTPPSHNYFVHVFKAILKWVLIINLVMLMYLSLQNEQRIWLFWKGSELISFFVFVTQVLTVFLSQSTKKKVLAWPIIIVCLGIRHFVFGYESLLETTLVALLIMFVLGFIFVAQQKRGKLKFY